MAQVKVRGTGRYAPSMVGYGKDEEKEKIMKNIMESSVVKNKP